MSLVFCIAFSFSITDPLISLETRTCYFGLVMTFGTSPHTHVWCSTHWTLFAEKLYRLFLPSLPNTSLSVHLSQFFFSRWGSGSSRALGSVCVPVVTHWEPAEKGGWAGCMLPLRVLRLLTCNVKWFSRKTQLVPPQLFSSCFQNRLLFQKSDLLHRWQWDPILFPLFIWGERKMIRSQRIPMPWPRWGHNLWGFSERG